MPFETGNDDFPPRRRKLRQSDTPTPEQLDIIFNAFEERITQIRAELSKVGKKGHLDLVTSSEFSEAKKNLYGIVGEKLAEEHMMHWFNLNFN